MTSRYVFSGVVAAAGLMVTATTCLAACLIPTGSSLGALIIAIAPGDHLLTAPVSDGTTMVVAQATAAKPAVPASVAAQKTPRLDSVSPIPLTPRDRAFQLALNGDNFGIATPQETLVIKMNDTLRKTCWLDDCSARPDELHGIVKNATLIVVSQFNRHDDTGAAFKVCFQDRCSEPQSDGMQRIEHAEVFTVALAITFLIAGLVIFLAWRQTGAVTLWGETYVITTPLLDEETGTYSLSKLQFYTWTAVAVFGYSYLTLSRDWIQAWHDLPPIPPTLEGIVGISAGTAVGARIVTQMNGPKGAGSLHAGISDFITTGGVGAVDRVQFLVWTLVVAAGFFLVIANLDPRVIDRLPEVPQSLVAISGISAFGYLGAKLARDPGPVINEVNVQTGPDPDAAPPVSGSTPAASALTPAWLQSIQTAVAAITDAQKKLGAVTGSSALASVLTPASDALTAAQEAVTDTAKLSPSSTDDDLTAARTAVDRHVADADKGANDAVKAKEAMAQGSPSAADFAAALSATTLTQRASKAVQDLQAALKTATPAAPTASFSTFGLIDVRGRALSRDANFKLSIRDDAEVNDFQLAYDRLEPSPTDARLLRRPRLVERDLDSRDFTLAKRLLLVVRLDDQTRQFFVPRSRHTLTLTNPDSQTAAFKFDVPEAQKPN
jgi:hypothetical protein